MCGLVAFISGTQTFKKEIADAKKAFMHNGLYISAFRGRDATGLALVNGIRTRPSVHKKAMPSSDFLDLRSTAKVLDDVDRCQAVLGHTRSSTRGWISDENAHPFQSEHITLIHNGTIPNYKMLQAKCDSDVDSAHVCVAIAEKGATEVLERISGEYAFIWHNALEGTVNVARNGHRPLFWAFVPDWEGYVFASEQEFLGLVCGRNQIKFSPTRIVYPSEHTIYTFDLSKKNMEYTSSPFVPLSARSRHGPRTGTINGSRNWKDDGSHRGLPTVFEGELGPTTISKEDFDFFVSLASEAKERIGRMNPKHMAHWANPVGYKQQLKAAVRVREGGFKISQIYGARAVVFQEYKKQQDYGCGAVRIMGTQLTIHDGEIHNLDRHQWDAVIRAKNLFVQVVNIRTEKGHPFAILDINEEFLRRALAKYEEELKETGEVPLTFLVGPQGELVAKDRWDDLVKNGCSMCTNPIDPLTADLVFWYNNSPLCVTCADDPDTQSYLHLRSPNENTRQINSN